MAISVTQMAKILYNRFIGGKSYTNEELSLDEEPFKGRMGVMFENVWIDDVPKTNPIASHTLYQSDTYYPSSGQQIIRKYHKQQLTPVTTSKTNKSFYLNTEFGNIIPSEYGDGSYQWELWKKDSNGNYTVKVPFGLYNWYFDSVNGVLIFLGEFPPGINNEFLLPAITCYQYVGRLGSANVLASASVSVDDISIKNVDGTISGKGKFRTVGYSANTLNANVNVTSNSFVITHGLANKYVSVDVYDNTTSARVRCYTKALNNSQVELGFSPNVRAGDFGVVITSLDKN